MSSFPDLRLIYFGTPEFAVPPLSALVRAGYPVLRVVTQPDRPRGRGGKLAAGPVKKHGMDLGLQVLQPLKISDPAFIELLRALRPDVAVVAAFGRILPPALLAVPRLGCVNVHASLLPRYRGAAPVHWAVMNGETRTGITTMLMDEGLDTGDILLQEELPIGPDDSMGMVYGRLARLGASLLLETLDQVAAGTLKPRPQDHSQASYAPPIRREHELIDWSRPPWAVKNQVRGLDPWPGAYTLLNGRELKVWRVETVDFAGGSPEPGALLQADPERGLVVRTGAGALRIRELQPAGRRRMRAEDFLRGHPPAEGTILGQPRRR